MKYLFFNEIVLKNVIVRESTISIKKLSGKYLI